MAAHDCHKAQFATDTSGRQLAGPFQRVFRGIMRGGADKWEWKLKRHVACARRPMLRNYGVAAALFAACVGVVPRTAQAYTIANALAEGCHEEITEAALRAVRLELPTAAPIAATDDEKALVDDLQFKPDQDMKDLGAATLLMAVRDNDLKGRGSGDLTQLAAVHGNPDGQQEHCLRSANEKEPGGSEAAVADCRAYVRGRIVEAIGALDATGAPDASNRTSLTVHLSLRGQVDAPLPTYYLKMGQAIHAIEDSFTHTYRTPDSTKITVVLNWLDEVNGTLVESRDGPGHAKQLDRCDDPDDIRKTRRALAFAAASGVLRASLDPGKNNDQKMAAVDQVLDMYLSYSPGCTFDNNWCNAPERQYANSAGCGCNVGNIDKGFGALLATGAVALLAVARRARRRKIRGSATSGVAGAMTALALLLLAPRSAHAQSPAPTTTATTTPPPDPSSPVTSTTSKPAEPATRTHAATPPTTTTTTIVPSETPQTQPTTETTVVTPSTTTTTVVTPTKDASHEPPPTVIPVNEPGPRDPDALAFGGYIGASGSIDKAALAGTAGLRLRVSKHWTFGLDGEWNPWLALNGTTVRAGALNIYGTAILRFPLAYEDFNLRTTLNVGVSHLLTNLYGAPSGVTGPYLGVSFLGVEWKISRVFYLIVNPLNIAVPVPQISGVPLVYPQYRFTVGLEAYFD